MSAPNPSDLIRISQIAGNYLVFEPQHASRLRRTYNICGVLVGTAPQNPQQNIYLGLPIQLSPGEARVLVERKVAYIVDETAVHLAALTGSDGAGRTRYARALTMQCREAGKLWAEEREARGASLTEDVARRRRQARSGMETEVDSKLPYIAITPTTSDDLIWKPICEALSSAGPKPNSLLRHLQGSGYYMMPGLRFGASFSVYPGDPLRFHAHFLANHYGWDEDIPMLDIVGSARLGTSVKKGFLIGGEAPETTSGRKQVRAFTLEWAGM